MDGTIYSVTLRKFSTQTKVEMFMRIVSKFEKLKDHSLNCKLKSEDCKICQKIILLMYSFIEYEKKENKKIVLEEALNDYDVEELILKDNDLFKILSFE